MDAPPIQYCKTSDSVNIAYAEAGAGCPLILVPIPGFSHAELIWQLFGAVQSLAARYHVVTYDSRGTGLSDRSAVDFSMEAMMRDLEAVIDRCGFESFVLASTGTGAPIAVTYAATHPERTSHLVLSDGHASFSDFAESPVYKAGVPLLDADWVLFTETFAQVLYFHANAEFGRRYAEYLRACCEPEAMRAVWKAWTSRDVSALLPQVNAPTLIIQNKNNRWFPIAAGQRLAAAIPGARLTLIDDITYAPVPDLIDEFVRGGDAAEPIPPSGAVRTEAGMTAILFLDIAGSTELTTRMGDAAYREQERALDTSLRSAIRESGGSPVEGKVLGDGVMATFASAKNAIDAALRCDELGRHAGLPLHLGIHAGDVIREDKNVHGGTVQVAARIADASAAGEVLVSQTVRDLARTSAGVSFEDRGERELKGVSEPVRVFAVRAALQSA
jgi:class 3 adenylate cyclase